jgi:uncharacterized transporter YbjL
VHLGDLFLAVGRKSDLRHFQMMVGEESPEDLTLDSGPLTSRQVLGPGRRSWANLWESFGSMGAVITLAPILIISIIARNLLQLNFISLCGLLAGSQTDPPVLAFAHGMRSSEAPSIAYASVYPLTMVLRIAAAQLLVLFFAA